MRLDFLLFMLVCPERILLLPWGEAGHDSGLSRVLQANVVRCLTVGDILLELRLWCSHCADFLSHQRFGQMLAARLLDVEIH